MADYTRGSHTVHDIKYHFVWLTKYRYKVLTGKIAVRLRELLIQGCTARGITIIEGAVGYDHVHMLVSCPTDISPSKIAQYLKGRSKKLMRTTSKLRETSFSRNLEVASATVFSEGFSPNAAFSRSWNLPALAGSRLISPNLFPYSL